uniref:Peptidyl-prolyl cis-trans isomerase n=1 Tax=Heterosigma akashiwo TaxID=2829 RepID=A0A7S3Y1Y7_HETAK
MYSTEISKSVQPGMIQRKPRHLNNIMYFDMTIDGEDAGRLTFELRADIAPKTCENFKALITGERGITEDGVKLSYEGSVFHRIVKDYLIQGGDIVNQDGTGRLSSFGEPFEDENFILRHTGPGVLSMCNSGPDSNGSQFFITLVETPWLDGRHVVFGCLVDQPSLDTLAKIEQVGHDCGRPSRTVVVARCGQLFP